MKKAAALLTSAAILSACVSCGNKSVSSSSNSVSERQPTVFEAVQLEDAAYKRENLKSPDDIKMIYCFEPYNGSSDYLILGTGENTPEFWHANADLSEFSPLRMENFKTMLCYDIDAAEDGTLVEFIDFADYGDLPDPSLPENYQHYYDNQQEYLEQAEYECRIITYSPDGTKLTDSPVTGADITLDEHTYITGIATNGETVLVCINGSYHAFTIDGQYLSVVEPEGGMVEEIGRDSSNNIICAVRYNDDTVQLRRLNAEGVLEESSVTYTMPESIHSELLPGTGDYSLYIVGQTAIYGIRSENAAIEPIFALNRADCQINDFVGFVIADDGDLIIASNKPTDGKISLKKYTPCTPEELDSIPVITIGTWQNDWDLPEFVTFINDSQDEFRVEVKEYFKSTSGSAEAYEKANERAEQKLRDDMLSGDIPDIFYTSTRGELGNFDLIHQDMLADLGEYLDNDEDFSRSDIFPSVMQAISDLNNGKIQLLPRTFNLGLYYTAKTKYVKDIDKWDIYTFIDVMRDPPQPLREKPESVTDNTQETKYARFVSMWDKWIDTNSLECDFDSDSFISFLEYCNEGVPETPPDENYQSEPTPDEMRINSAYYQIRFADDYEIFDNVLVGDYQSYMYLAKGEFGGEPITTMGSPSLDGSSHPYSIEVNNCFSIYAKSDKKDLAWKCLKYIFSDEFTSNFLNTYTSHSSRSYGGLPITTSGMALQAEKNISDTSSFDYTDAVDQGTYSEDFRDYHGMIWYHEKLDSVVPEFVKIGSVDEEIVETVNDMISKGEYISRGSVSAITGTDIEAANELYNLANEETSRYFNGEVTAEQCAETMQDRISIYLSEKYG